MITYSLKESGVFYIDFSGTVTLEDIQHYLLEFEQLEDLPQKLLALYDLQDANLNLCSEDIIALSELTEKVTRTYKLVNTAFVVNRPNLTAYSILFSVDNNLENTTRQVFTSEKEALKWLLE